MKSPVAETVPTSEFPPAIPFTFQLTNLLPVLVTVAMNCCVAPNNTFAVVGAIVTVIADALVMVTLAEDVAAESA